MATKRLTGAALPVAHVQTIAVADTWATADLANLTMNLKTLTLTVGSTATTAQIAADLVDMWNGAAVNGTETRNETGDNVPEFNEITATLSSSTLVMTHDTKGVPFVVTRSETTAGDGTLGAVGETTAANGPSFWNTAANYDNNIVPTTGDLIYIDSIDIPILYGLDGSAVTLASLTIGANVGSTFAIGLPKTNANAYPEYRSDYLSVGATLCNISGGNRIKLNFGSVQNTTTIFGSGFSQELGVPAVLLKGTHASNSLEVISGEVGFAFYGGEAGTLAALKVSGGNVTVGDGATLTGCTATVGGGSVRIGSAISAITQSGGRVTVDGAATVTTLTMTGGTIVYNSSGTCTAATITNGSLDLSGDTSPVTFTDLTLGIGGSYSDPHGRLTVTNKVGRVAGVSRFQAS